MLKVKIFGYRGKFNSTIRIEEELKLLNCEITDLDPDLIIHLTGGFEDAQITWQAFNQRAIRLYCLLDIDLNKDINWYDNIKNDLNNCEIPCAISQFAANQIKDILKVESKINILPYPIRPITNLNYLKSLEFLYVGRVYSQNKRFELIGKTLDLLKVGRHNLVVVGTEKPPFGYYAGELNDEMLNEIYNSARFTFLLSSFEGIGLTAIEAAITGSFPILCNDNKVVEELGLEDFAVDPDPRAIANKINDIITNKQGYYEILDKIRPMLSQKYDVKNVAKKIISLYNDFKDEK